MAIDYSRNTYLICTIGTSYLSSNNSGDRGSGHGGWKHDFPK